MEQATRNNPAALIVAFGSPSNPEPQEEALRGLAAKVSALLPGWNISSATLAKPGSLQQAAELLGRPVIYPFFMAEGFIVDRMLMPRARKLGLSVLRPFGVESSLSAHAARVVERMLAERGLSPHETTLLVAAHGSAGTQSSPDSAYAFAADLRKRLGLKASVCGFLEQAPLVADVARSVEKAICLTFFNLKAGHVRDDVPAALVDAGFDGPVIDAFITWPQTAEIIAESLAANGTVMAKAG